MAKPRINLRFNQELVEGADNAAPYLGLDKTGYMELAVAEKLIREKRSTPGVRPLVRALVERGERKLGPRRRAA